MKWGAFFLGALLAAGANRAMATNGYFVHGYGIKAQGQAGVSIAQPQDALAAANNPAGTAWIGDRVDFGATLFGPDREAWVEGNAAGGDGHYKGNAKELFLIPEFGVSKQLSDRVGVGLAVYGNGGMNTEYRQNPYGAFGSRGSAGVDFSQLFLTPSVAYKFTENQSVGLGINLVYQRFAAQGLGAFANPGFSDDPANVTGRGHDTSFGVGFRLGWQGEVIEGLTVGATWSSKIKTRKFDRYAGLFADGGSFDVPENYGVGLAFKATPRLTFGADIQVIKYGSVRSVGRDFDLQSIMYAGNRLGSRNGPGFGWRDIAIYKFSVSYALASGLILRGGYSHAEQPVPASQTFLGILAPGIIQDHVSVGLTWVIAQANELSLAYTHGFAKTVRGKDSIPAAFGGGESNLRMSQNVVGLAYGWKF